MLSYYSEVNIHYKRNLLVALSFIEFITLSIFVKGAVEVYTIGTNDLKNGSNGLKIDHQPYFLYYLQDRSCKSPFFSTDLLVRISFYNLLKFENPSPCLHLRTECVEMEVFI